MFDVDKSPRLNLRVNLRLLRLQSGTDNVMLLFSHLTRQGTVDSGDIRQYLGIGEDFEDIC